MATIFWIVVALILLVLGLMNGLNNEMEGYKFAFLFIGIFLAPMIWLIINIIVSKGFKESK
ncbi:hypothetical protein DB790_03520 [Staphylococcus capitis]|uniref:hypothetical protein n=1 Tax=Staphylococcus capitis TaxID=29388 RepID=UPI000F977EF5|nr:hypothetical protein [Staphylococcus capitis]RQX47468.1 hypothetical protein DB790_03520 [Staphylococcus capitis]